MYNLHRSLRRTPARLLDTHGRYLFAPALCSFVCQPADVDAILQNQRKWTSSLLKWHATVRHVWFIILGVFTLTLSPQLSFLLPRSARCRPVPLPHSRSFTGVILICWRGIKISANTSQSMINLAKPACCSCHILPRFDPAGCRENGTRRGCSGDGRSQERSLTFSIAPEILYFPGPTTTGSLNIYKGTGALLWELHRNGGF